MSGLRTNAVQRTSRPPQAVAITLEERPYVLFSGAACLRLAVCKMPEDLAQPIRKAADIQREIDAAGSRQSEGEWLTVQETAEELGITEREVRHLCQYGKLTARKFGKRWQIYAGDVRLFQ